MTRKKAHQFEGGRFGTLSRWKRLEDLELKRLDVSLVLRGPGSGLIGENKTNIEQKSSAWIRHPSPVEGQC